MTRIRHPRAKALRTYVACGVGESYYVLPVEEVQEIVQPMHLTALPHAPPGIVGAVEHRDQVVPILDLGARLGFGETLSPRRKWVLLRGETHTIGVVVSQVHEVFEVDIDKLKPAPEVGDAAARVATHVLKYNSDMAFVLDLKAVAALADVTLPEKVGS